MATAHSGDHREIGHAPNSRPAQERRKCHGIRLLENKGHLKGGRCAGAVAEPFKIFLTLARKKVAKVSSSLILSSPLVGPAGEGRNKAAFGSTA